MTSYLIWNFSKCKRILRELVHRESWGYKFKKPRLARFFQVFIVQVFCFPQEGNLPGKIWPYERMFCRYSCKAVIERNSLKLFELEFLHWMVTVLLTQPWCVPPSSLPRVDWSQRPNRQSKLVQGELLGSLNRPQSHDTCALLSLSVTAGQQYIIQQLRNIENFHFTFELQITIV